MDTLVPALELLLDLFMLQQLCPLLQVGQRVGSSSPLLYTECYQTVTF